MTLTDIIPWGRSLDEYTMMFSLTEADLEKTILGVGDGPASFNAELTAQGGRVVSVDPIYQFSGHDIKKRVEQTYDTVVEQMRINKDRFVWDHFQDADALGEHRLQTMNKFFADYETGRQQNRYLAYALPELPFSDQSFDSALVSHLLFLYSDHLSKSFHIDAISNLLRVASEIRIFPLLNLSGHLSPWVVPVITHLEQGGYQTSRVRVPYEFQKGGNEMLHITNA